MREGTRRPASSGRPLRSIVRIDSFSFAQSIVHPRQRRRVRIRIERNSRDAISRRIRFPSSHLPSNHRRPAEYDRHSSRHSPLASRTRSTRRLRQSSPPSQIAHLRQAPHPDRYHQSSRVLQDDLVVRRYGSARQANELVQDSFEKRERVGRNGLYAVQDWRDEDL